VRTRRTVQSLTDDNTIYVDFVNKRRQKDPKAISYSEFVFGCKLDDQGDVYGALQAFQRALDADPGNYDALINQANLFFHLDRVDDAIKLYLRAIRVNLHRYEAFYNLGVALYEKKDLDNSLVNLKRALDRHPKHVDGHFNTAHVLEDLGRHEEAKKHWDTYLKLKTT
jgi:tetratricopeptide (TPR) repeat protein